MALGPVEPKYTLSGQTGLTCLLSLAGGQSGPAKKAEPAGYPC